MDIVLNFGLAWISLMLAVILAVAYLTRKAIVWFPGLRKGFVKTNKVIRRHHKLIGIALIITALLHGLFSSDKILSLNIGTLSWLLAVFMGINWMLRKKLIKYRGWIFYHRVLAVLFALSIVIHVIDVGGIQVFNIMKPIRVEQPARNDTTTPEPDNFAIVTPEPSSDMIYADGLYTGEATGFRPGLKVSVELQDDRIISVEVIDHNEVSPRFYELPISIIPQKILETQSTDVDAISGATCTSEGIMAAVEDALEQAEND